MYRKSRLSDCRDVYHLICELEEKELDYASFSEIFAAQVENPHFYCIIYEQEGNVTVNA